MMSLFVADNGASNRITISDAGTLPEMPQSQTPDIARTPGINSAACGLFFGDTPLKTIPSNPQSATDPDEPIALQGDPASDLRQAIAFDLAGEPARARRLYLWLTAADPNVTTTIDCGNGIILTGTITSLAQKRLKALDAGNPDLARSREIDAVIAAATVAPGPELPNPPTIKRNRDFYNNTIAANVPPEDSITPRTTMKMDVSANTARLTSVDRPAARVASPTVPTQAPAAAAPTIAPTPSKAASAALINTSAPPGTIKGSAITPSASNKALLSTTRPVESGTLELADEVPVASLSMIEVPMVDTTTDRPITPKPVAVPEPTTSAKAQSQVAPPSSPYYTVQLAAYRSREMAESRWQRFQAMGDGILGGATHNVQSIAIEGKGLFFRLMTGQYTRKTDAQSACNGLKRAGIDCLIRQVTP
ncbi:SPOR domain-containing protein [Thalassospira alkalitolerans]|uniref:SPOR domain-containing protein n=1 Tax=Thalassospira alkalitolerans TaxID=1293890 RepID=UPI003AA9A7E6